MKKFIVRSLIVLVVLVILAVVGAVLFLNVAIKRGVETFGPQLTKVDIKLQSVRLSLLSGGGTIKGLVVGNPEGFKTPSAIRLGEATLVLEPRSLLSDKLVIKTINVQAPDITFETDLKHNNLSKILSNVQEATGGGGNAPAKPQEPAPAKETKPARKLEVDDFVIKGGKIRVSVTGLIGGAATVPLPDIHLQGLGTGPDGITTAELIQRVLEAIEKGATQAASGTLTDISKGAVYFSKDASNVNSNALQNATKDLGGFLKKK